MVVDPDKLSVGKCCSLFCRINCTYTIIEYYFVVYDACISPVGYWLDQLLGEKCPPKTTIPQVRNSNNLALFMCLVKVLSYQAPA